MQDIDLSQRPRSRDHLPEWYATALEDQATSGLSMADYAGELGIAPATLYQWKRRLSAEDPGEFETPASLGLVEVSIEDRPSHAASGPVVVRLGNGRCVEVPKQFDDDDLIRLIEILESC
jgi:transposase-like protein